MSGLSRLAYLVSHHVSQSVSQCRYVTLLWNAFDQTTRVYSGTWGSQRSVGGPNEIAKERFSFCRGWIRSLVFVDRLDIPIARWTLKNCGDSILAKFNNHRSDSTSCFDRILLWFVHVKSSVAVCAEISPRKLFTLIIKKYIYRVKVSKKWII